MVLSKFKTKQTNYSILKSHVTLQAVAIIIFYSMIFLDLIQLCLWRTLLKHKTLVREKAYAMANMFSLQKYERTCLENNLSKVDIQYISDLCFKKRGRIPESVKTEFQNLSVNTCI